MPPKYGPISKIGESASSALVDVPEDLATKVVPTLANLLPSVDSFALLCKSPKYFQVVSPVVTILYFLFLFILETLIAVL